MSEQEDKIKRRCKRCGRWRTVRAMIIAGKRVGQMPLPPCVGCGGRGLEDEEGSNGPPGEERVLGHPRAS